MAETEAKWVPPYISFTSLTGLLDRMHNEGGAPPQIDRSYLSSFSGGYQSQVIAALRSLALIDDKGSVTERLTALVESDKRGERAVIIADLLREFYPEAVRLGTIKATQGQLEEAFRQYGIGGDTLRKAIAFYLGAAKYANLPISTNFRVPSVTASDGRKTPGKGRGRKVNNDAGDERPHPPQPRQDESWQGKIDPAILAWLKRIPPQDEAWAPEDRAKWEGVLHTLLGGIYD